MLIIPAIVVLFTYLYWRLHQVYDVFQPLTVYVALALVLFALLLDFRMKAIRFRGSPLTLLMGLFYVWCALDLAIKAPENFNREMVVVTTSLIAYLAVSEGLQTLRGLGFAAGVLVFFSLALSAIGVEQGLSPTLCYPRVQNSREEAAAVEISDGRSCETANDCLEGGIPNSEYRCEHPGLLGTHSINRRVRYRGLLEDPNELSWAISMAIPLSFAFFERRRTRRRLLIAVAMVVLGAICVIKTQSRSGQLAILAALGVYFIRRFRWRGIAVGAVLSIPLLLLGGRSGESAESSSEERLNCWNEALSMWRDNPITGVGTAQFIEHYFLTAHNSFLLAVAELGPIGLFLWTAIIYYTFKVTLQAQKQLAGRPEAASARAWATALLASMAALAASAMFLSLNYHPILWIHLGLVGSLYTAIRIHEPNFSVKLGWRDLALVAGFDVLFIAAVSIYLRIKGI